MGNRDVPTTLGELKGAILPPKEKPLFKDASLDAKLIAAAIIALCEEIHGLGDAICKAAIAPKPAQPGG